MGERSALVRIAFVEGLLQLTTTFRTRTTFTVGWRTWATFTVAFWTWRATLAVLGTWATFTVGWRTWRATIAVLRTWATFTVAALGTRTFLTTTLGAWPLQFVHAAHELRTREQMIAILIEALEQGAGRRTLWAIAFRTIASAQLAGDHQCKKWSQEAKGHDGLLVGGEASQRCVAVVC